MKKQFPLVVTNLFELQTSADGTTGELDKPCFFLLVQELIIACGTAADLAAIVADGTLVVEIGRPVGR